MFCKDDTNSVQQIKSTNRSIASDMLKSSVADFNRTNRQSIEN